MFKRDLQVTLPHRPYPTSCKSNQLSLHNALPIFYRSGQILDMKRLTEAAHERNIVIGFDLCHSVGAIPHELHLWGDRKSTRLNSSHVAISYAVFCLKKKISRHTRL